MRALFRLSRAVVVALTTVLLAAGAHTAGGGSLPDPLIVTGVLALVTLPVIALAGRRISAPIMLAVLGAGQFGLHDAFNALSVSASTTAALGPNAGHVHVLGVLGESAAGGHTHSDSTAMLLAHAIATVLTALLLARGESAVWALLGWFRPLVRLLVAITPLARPSVPAFTEAALPRAWRSLRLPARRGPPSAFTVS
ncbi:hypothetical protein [Sinomonas terrae]|uniref:Integral membrane protein n=1 Tax=Sinomonas terrae TaxID=2908838 RepID=A0ABS9TVS8_9MICC|nr:hypothetical protein [Sinomonas terrae]MCH6468461.1 hypothetical protein [Sinomonas terrae]